MEIVIGKSSFPQRSHSTCFAPPYTVFLQNALKKTNITICGEVGGKGGGGLGGRNALFECKLASLNNVIRIH